MNVIVKIFSILFRLVAQWIWFIPVRFGAVAMFLYLGVSYLIFGTLEVFEIKRILGDEWSIFFGWLIPFGWPTFLSFASMFGGGSNSTSKSNTLDDAIKFRDGQMGIHSDKVASEIFMKTSHLDVMRANQSNSRAYGQASRGFDAKYGTHSPSYIYNDIVKK